MHARLVMIAAAALTIGATAAAEPPKSEPRDTAQPANRSAEVILASADQVRAVPVADEAVPAADQPVATPAKRPRAARVTSCRCGEKPQK